MTTIKVNTNLHCGSCVSKLAPHLDNNDQIANWTVDLRSDPKSLTITGNNLSEGFIQEMLSREGYSIVARSKSWSFWTDKIKWKRAMFNTLNCLIGCSIGDFAMIIFLQAYFPDTTMTVQMVLAIAAGLTTSIMLETMILRKREGFDLVTALKTAMGMSFISMVGMEIAMNSTDFLITGGKAAFNDPQYWMALIIAMAAGFVAPLPYNYYRLKKYNQACH